MFCWFSLVSMRTEVWILVGSVCFAAVAERDLQQEMPTMKGAGSDVVGVMAQLNKEAKQLQRSSQRIQERKEKETERFIQTVTSSSSSEIEEIIVPPTPSKCRFVHVLVRFRLSFVSAVQPPKMKCCLPKLWSWSSKVDLYMYWFSLDILSKSCGRTSNILC